MATNNGFIGDNMRKKIIILTLLIISFGLGLTAMFLLSNKKLTNDPQPIVYKIEEAGTKAVAKAYDSVVVVITYNNEKVKSNGTGFVYKKNETDAYVMTNYHVVEKTDEIKITFNNNETVSGELLGYDEVGDIAIIKISSEHVISVAEIGDTKNLEIGNTVYAIGSPFNSDYSGTTTMGCISAKDRMISYPIENNAYEAVLKVIQTDSAINPGNSGGPLIDLSGHVIGITSSKLMINNVEGIGFAIPIEDAFKRIDKLEKGEEIKRPYLGVTLVDIIDKYILFLNKISLSEKITYGSVVLNVSANSVAFESGLKKGDVIISVNDVKVKNTLELKYEIYSYEIDEEIKIKYYRGDNIKETTIQLKPYN